MGLTAAKHLKPHTSKDVSNETHNTAGLIVYCLLTAVLAASFLCVSSINGPLDEYSYNETLHQIIAPDQYGQLGDALLHGQLNLNLEVPDELAALDNPYDCGARYAIGSPDVPIYWDHAFYHGKYYCYFGVAPAVLVFAPYEAITGSILSEYAAVCFLGVLAVIATAFLILSVRKRFFPSASYPALSISLIALVIGINVSYLGFASCFYSVPILSSLIFTSLGLGCWMRCYDGKGGRVAPGLLFLGCSCMAMNVVCRPQFILASFLAFPLLWSAIRARRLFSKSSVGASVLAVAPYVVILGLAFVYNIARFGSPLDFGANYNLTGYDMTQYRQPWRLTANLLVRYLFQPLIPCSDFPYIIPYSLGDDLGFAPNEPFFGGFFVLKPFSLFVIAFFALIKRAREKKAMSFVLVLAVLTIAILIIETRMCGLSHRYFSDFGLFLTLGAIYGFLLLWEHLKKRGRILLNSAAALLLAFSLVLVFLMAFSPARYYSVQAENPALYQQVTSLFSQTPQSGS